MDMKLAVQIVQVLIALALLNVWILRKNMSTNYRGANALSLKDEFIAYGLPVWFFYLVGFLKITASILLLVGVWIPALVLPAAETILVLMLGAILMHIKVGDPLVKSLPAALIFALSFFLCWALW